MAYEVFELDDLPALVMRILADHDPAQEMVPFFQEGIARLDALDHDVYLIMDTLNLSISFEELLQGSSEIARGASPLYRHPRIIQIITVASNRMLKLAASGMQSNIFGNLQIQIFDTMDDAAAYVRDNVNQ